MLIAHVEREGVWLVEGGMHRLALALADLAKTLGVSFRYVSEVQQILIANGQAAGVRLATGERLGADAVVLNADVAALAGRLFGAVRPRPRHAQMSRDGRCRRSPGRCTRRQRGFRCCDTTCFSRATTRPSLPTSSAPRGFPRSRPSMSARRIVATTMGRSTSPSACCAWSMRRRAATHIPSPRRRSRNAKHGHSP